MQYKKIEGIAYNLHLIKTDKFKKNMIKINFKNKVVKEDIVKRRLIPDILVESNLIYNTKRLLDIKTEELYNLDVFGRVTISGNTIISSFTGVFLNDKYSEKGLLSDSLKFIFDLIFKPKVENNEFDKKAFNLATTSLNEEIESLKEDPNNYGHLRAMEELAPDTPVSYHLCGYKEDLDKVTPKSLYQYYLSMLRSDIVDIYIIGNIDIDEVTKIVKDNFKINTKKKGNYDSFINYNKFKNKYRTIDEQIDNKQSLLEFGFKLGNLTPFEKQYVLPIYTYILGGGPDSKLFMNVREKNSLCYSISCHAMSVSNLMIIKAGINGCNYKKAVELIKKEIKSMEKGDFTTDDMEKAKITFICAYEEVTDSLGSILDNYISHEYLGFDLIEEKEKNIIKVTKKDIMKIIPKIHPELIYFLEGTREDEEDTVS